MFGYDLKRFGFNWVVIAITTLIAVAGFSGYNSITKSWDWRRGFENVAAIFGGLVSFGAILLLLLVGYFVFTSVKYTADKDGVSNSVPGFLALGYVAVALFAGAKWISLPSGAGLILVAFVVLITIAAALVTGRAKSPAVIPPTANP